MSLREWGLRVVPWTARTLAILSLAALAARPGVAMGAEPKPLATTTIAALPFTDSSPGKKYGPLADGMGDLLGSFLSKAKGLVIVERAELDKVLREHELIAPGLIDAKTKIKLGRLLGAKYILSGGVTVLNGKLQINAHLLEVETTRVALSVEATGKVDGLFKPAAELAKKLAKVLHVKLPEITEKEIDREPIVNLHFMRGLGYYYAKMRDHAIAEFMKTLALKPKHAQARYWNAVCYFDGKEYEHAAIELDRFLKDFPNHQLAPKVRGMREKCTAEIKKKTKAKAKAPKQP